VASAFLGGLGLFGMAVAAFFGFVTLLFLPLWALLDCALSRRARGEKAGVILGLLFTWGLGSVVYGLFFAQSRLLRVATVIAVGGVLVVFVPSVATLMAGARVATQTKTDGAVDERRVPSAVFKPDMMPASAVGTFHAVHFTGTGLMPTAATIARFAHASLDAASARDTDRAIRHVVFDGQGHRYWGLTTHNFGAVSPADGRFTPVAPSPAVGDFSWPTGIAFDASTGLVYIATSHVYTRFYRFDPRASRWEQLPSELSDLPILGLAHLASDGCLYAVERQTGDRMLRRLRRFNTEGASLGAVDLRPPIPIPDAIDARVQLVATEDALVLLLPPVDASSTSSRVVVVDPATGIVRAPTTAAQVAGGSAFETTAAPHAPAR
jgi:hypothetical protein